MNEYPKDLKPSDGETLRISGYIRKGLREDYEVADIYTRDSIDYYESYEDEITAAYNRLKDMFSYNYNEEFNDY
jgi:hypothetical protein